MKSFSQIIKNKFDLKYQQLEKQVKNAKTLFNPKVATYQLSQFRRICSYIVKTKSPENLKRNINVVTSRIVHSEQWIMEIKNQLNLIGLIRQFNQLVIPFVFEYLSQVTVDENKFQRERWQPQNINLLVELNIILNLKTYLEKICQNSQLYQQIRKGKENWQPNASPPILFKILNIINYLLATKNTLHKLFKNYDSIEVFHVITRYIIEDLNSWYSYYITKLSEIIQNSQQLQKIELKSLQQLIYESDKIYLKLDQFNIIATIYNIDVKIYVLDQIKLPPHFKAKFQFANLNETKQSIKSSSFIERIIKIDNQDRNFIEDILGNSHQKKKLKQGARNAQKLNKSLANTKIFLQYQFEE